MYRSCTIYLNLDVCRIYFWLTIHQHPILQGSPHFQRTGRLDFSLREHERKVKALQGDFQQLHRDMFLQKCVVGLCYIFIILTQLELFVLFQMVNNQLV